ncbi:MAG TPA: hypothetical protein VJ499_10520 [Flavisolibacter sp.]|nr:hypothetical protein [Flavisolibacter sp.]
MSTQDEQKNVSREEPKMPNPSHQEKADPNLTELRGFTDPNERLEPLDKGKENTSTKEDK